MAAEYSNATTSRLRGWQFWLISFALFAGLILSIIAWLRLCTDSCANTHNYRFFGQEFEPLGLIFFSTALVLHFFSFEKIVALMVFGGLGAEIKFIAIQKYDMEQWCPVCLSIAACLLLAGLIFISKWISNITFAQREGDNKMLRTEKLTGFFSSLVFIVGLLTAIFAVTVNTEVYGEDKFKHQDPFFGKKSSPIEVYFISDWFCPSCRSVETRLEKSFPKIMSKAGLMFIDLDVHPETMNYVPFHLSFLLNNKDQYFELRKLLHGLSLMTKTPNDQQVQQAIDETGVVYEQLNYSDVDAGIHFFEDVAKKYNVQSTPTVVIVNKRKNLTKKLHGSEITEESVMQAIDELSK